MKDIVWENYEIHNAAGTFFVVNISQQGDVFEKPLEVNEFGALACNYLKNGKTLEETAALLSEEYEADFSEVKKDVEIFYESLLNGGLA
ncbi:MAG: PqqD family protein [Lachnospiraceae bacterium]|nr:PqqD family protein [Lachnospiraceae bacterium]